MKALRIILIILGVIVAAILIIPLFAPATVKVTAETEIALEPEQIFPFVASYTSREVWDPWAEMDTTTVVTVVPAEGYVGSTYEWEGERLGTGRMEVQSVVENEYIQSSLWFGDVPTASVVEWTFEPVEGGTHVTWSFSEETTYPFERLRMMMGKMFLQQSFEKGLANLREHLEANPPAVSMLGPISVEIQPGFMAIGVSSSGTMENIGEDMGRIFGLVMQAMQAQGSQMSGPPFAHYLDYDETTGVSNYYAGVPVVSAGKRSGEVLPMTFPEVRVLQAVHTGPYEEFESSYNRLMAYAAENGIRLTGSSYEFYLNDPESEPDPSRWQTRIAFVVE